MTLTPLRDAFTPLVEQYQRALHLFVYGLVHDGELARDLVQDTFSAAWKLAQRETAPFTRATLTMRDYEGRLDAGGDLRRWLFHTAYCRVISTQRRQRLLHWAPLEHAAGAPEQRREAPFEDAIAESEAVRAALARLSAQDVACLFLRIVEGLSAAETGEIVGASAQVVAKRLERAKRRLRDAYLTADSQTSQTTPILQNTADAQANTARQERLP